jgi:hypothetical protein
VVFNVLAGRTTSQRVLGMARQMLEEPPIPPPARLSPEEKRSRIRARSAAYRRRLTVEQLEQQRKRKCDWKRKWKLSRTAARKLLDRKKRNDYRGANIVPGPTSRSRETENGRGGCGRAGSARAGRCHSDGS